MWGGASAVRAPELRRLVLTTVTCLPAWLLLRARAPAATVWLLVHAWLLSAALPPQICHVCLEFVTDERVGPVTCRLALRLR